MATIEETKRMIEVMQAYVDGREIEVKANVIFCPCSPCRPAWNWVDFDYRVRETPDVIDWSHVDPRFKWMARDEDGEQYLYERKPNRSTKCWADGPLATSLRIDGVFASYRRGTVDWKDSLVERPEGV